MKRKDVIREANRLIREHREVTVRQIYYQIYPKFHSDYKNARSFYSSYDRMLVRAREEGAVPVNRVIDTARNTMGGDFGSTNPDDYLQNCINRFLRTPNSYHRKRWDNQSTVPVVWVEKDALSRIIHGISQEYAVMTCPSRGYSSMHYLWRVAEENDNIKILHFADHDPSGLDMTRDLKSRVSAYAGRIVPVERIGLTHEQVEEFDLVPNPTKRADSRRRRYVERFGDKCWELDALPPDVLRELVRDSIEGEIDTDLWNETLDQEKREREKLRKSISGLKGKLEELVGD